MKHINYIIYFFFVLFLGTVSISAQGVKIKDQSVQGSSPIAKKNSVLELESISRGFLLPRMTSEQRDKISIDDKMKGNGLTIYNTDNDCINYWSTLNDKWMSLCGTLPPSVVYVDPTFCSNITFVNGRNGSNKLIQGEYLIPTDILYVDVFVAQVGRYDITAVTDNGYYFSASGTFRTRGSVRVPLTGVGVPTKGGVYDTIQFFVNGKSDDACSSFKIEVGSTSNGYDIISIITPEAQGKYYWNVPVDSKTNYIDVKVDVKGIGPYTIKTTDTQLGLSYSGSGVFTKTGEHIVRLVAHGIPTSNEEILETTFKLITNSNGENANKHTATFKTKIEKFAYRIDLSKSTHHGIFERGKKIPEDSYLILEVEVLAPSHKRMLLDLQQDGIEFKSDEYNFAFNGNGNLHKVRFNAKRGTLPNQDKFVIVGVPPYYNTYEIPLSTPRVDFSINCSTMKTFGYYKIGKGISGGTSNYAEVEIDVKEPGNITITTEKNSIGLSASFSGRVSKGKQKIKLTITGTPTREATGVKLRLRSDDLGGLLNCYITLNIDGKYPMINILVVGTSSNGPVSSTHPSRKILQNTSYFGPSGIVKVKGINVAHYGSTSINNATASKSLATYLVERKTDIVLVVGGANFSQSGLTTLTDFIKKGGVVIYSTNTQSDNVISIIGTLTGKKPTVNSRVNTYRSPSHILYGSSLTTGPIAVIDGHYRFGTSSKNNLYWQNIPSPMSPLGASDLGSVQVLLGYSKSIGFAFVGDGQWMNAPQFAVNGNKVTTYNNHPTGPLAGGILSPKRLPVHNSAYYANLMAWAINYRIKQLDK